MVLPPYLLFFEFMFWYCYLFNSNTTMKQTDLTLLKDLPFFSLAALKGLERISTKALYGEYPALDTKKPSHTAKKWPLCHPVLS